MELPLTMYGSNTTVILKSEAHHKTGFGRPLSSLWRKSRGRYLT